LKYQIVKTTRLENAAIGQWRARLEACVEAEGGHFEHAL